MGDFAYNILLFQDFRRGCLMSGTTKRLDLQFGAFACSVQGFDDPVQPVRQVLQALQNMLEETPEAGDMGIAFDAGEIDRLIGEVARRADLDEENVEIIPGLIIVHRGNVADAEDLEVEGAADIGDDEAWSRPFVAGSDNQGGDGPGSDNSDGESAETVDTGEPHQPDAEEDAEPGYINIFTPAASTGSNDVADAGSTVFAAATDDTPDEDKTEAEDDSFASRLRRIGTEPGAGETGVGETGVGETEVGETGVGEPEPLAEAGEAQEDIREDVPVLDIFADPGENTDGSVFANPMAANIVAEPVDGDAPINFFANSADSETGAEEPDDETADEGDILNLAASRNVFTKTGLGDTGLLDSAAPPGDDEAGYDGPGQDDLGSGNSERGEALFGRSENQPEIEEADEGYTAAGLAKAANAETVPELMVSAAAWMVLIQGQTTFTRHDVIDVFESIPGEHSKTLEARIKGFGKAVRNGHLIMIEDGVFGLSRAELDRFQSLL
jgi:hypothetical protein